MEELGGKVKEGGKIMSTEAAKAFIEKMKTDQQFCMKIMMEDDVTERMKLIHAAGFDCTMEEIQYQAKLMRDDDMASVAEAIADNEDMAYKYILLGFRTAAKKGFWMV